jgi:hypothetical protein
MKSHPSLLKLILDAKRKSIKKAKNEIYVTILIVRIGDITYKVGTRLKASNIDFKVKSFALKS